MKLPTGWYVILDSKEVQKKVELNLTLDDVRGIYNFSKKEFESIQKKLSRVMDIANKIQTDKEINNLVEKSFSKILSKHKDEPLNEEIAKEFYLEVSEAFVRFTNRGLNNNRL